MALMFGVSAALASGTRVTTALHMKFVEICPMADRKCAWLRKEHAAKKAFHDRTMTLIDTNKVFRLRTIFLIEPKLRSILFACLLIGHKGVCRAKQWFRGRTNFVC
jgi:hypothetical protein